MNTQKIVGKKKKNLKVKKYSLREMLEYVEKNFEKHPNLNVVKWMEKNGR